jgi:hypothetical protein
MSRKQRAGGGKRDTAEQPIREALEAVGARTWQLGGTGNPDLLVLYRGRYYVGEAKTGRGRRTRNQTDIPWPVWRVPLDALITIGAVHARE